MARPPLLGLTAAAAAIAALANGVGAALPSAPAAGATKSRLGVSIGQEMSERDQAAARRKRALDLREQAARATEARLKADLEARRSEETAAQPGPAAAKEAEGGDQFEDLARIYQAMKPAKAAVVFEQLELDVQMRIAQRMRERSTAMLLAAMTPKGAATLSMALARRFSARPRASTSLGRPGTP